MGNVEIVGRDLAQLIETLGRTPFGPELEDWLVQHGQVTELYAGPLLLDNLVYRYLTPPSDRADAQEVRHSELEHQLHETPDSRELYQVYGDWLQQHGDPLGDLIALGVASANGTDGTLAYFQRHLELHKLRLLGGLARQLEDRVALRWSYGMVHAIEELAEVLSLQIWEQLLQLRVCELLESIALLRPITPELDAAIDVGASESLRELHVAVCHNGLPNKMLRRNLQSLTVLGGRIIIGVDTLPASLEHLELRVHDAARADNRGSPLQLNMRELHVVLTAPVAAFLTSVQFPHL